MADKEIFLIRHGQTDFNLRGVVQGSGIDSDLNSTGKKQAEAFFNTYRETGFHAVYTSALKRTMQSVQGFIDMGLPHHILPGLNEISWGHKEGKIPNSTDDKAYKYLMEQWSSGQTHLKIEGGESPEEVLQRQIPALAAILAKKEETKILICMHGRAMRILLTHLAKQPLSYMDTYPHKNLCLYQFRYLSDLGQFHFIKKNDTSHCKELKVI